MRSACTMFNEGQEKLLKQTTRICQIIAFALIMGVLVFAGIILGVGLGPDQPPETPIVSIVGSAVGLAALPAWMIIPGLVVAGLRRKVVAGEPISNQPGQQYPEETGDVGPLVGVYQAKKIFGFAVLEGAAFINLIAYLLEGQSMNIAIAAGLLCLMMFGFPVQDSVERFVRQELETVEQQRGLQG